MRAYDSANEEARRARDLLKDWTVDGFLTKQQYQQMEQETVCELRRTNIFLRIVLFLFTLIIVGAGVALCFVVFVSRPGEQTTGFFLMAFGAVSYAAAEFAVSQFRLYRYGIEEALAVCSVGLLCAGMYIGIFGGRLIFSPARQGVEFLVPATGAILSLWVWHRFGFHYAFLAATIFAIWLPGYWTASHAAQHMIVAALYAIGLIAVVAVRPRERLTYLNTTYSIAEGLLWLGIYLAINLQISSVNLARQWWGGNAAAAEFSKPFYWATFVMIWCLPPVVLARGLQLKDRFAIAAGALAACLTLVTNKSYLGWERHSWDPMLLGVVLIAVAVFIRRWLAGGPGEIRHGFTARRLSGKDKRWMDAGVAAFGLVSPGMITPRPQPQSPDVHFGGGTSGGGGASSDF
jgi:uncharacterized membrane protein YgcG